MLKGASNQGFSIAAQRWRGERFISISTGPVAIYEVKHSQRHLLATSESNGLEATIQYFNKGRVEPPRSFYKTHQHTKNNLQSFININSTNVIIVTAIWTDDGPLLTDVYHIFFFLSILCMYFLFYFHSKFLTYIFLLTPYLSTELLSQKEYQN